MNFHFVDWLYFVTLVSLLVVYSILTLHYHVFKSTKLKHNKYKNKYLINEFLVDENISSYYFTDLVERNVYKYKDYKCIAQFNAIKQFLVEKNDIDLILYSISDNKLSRVLSTLDLPTKDISSAAILPNALRIRGNHLRQFFVGIVTGLLYIFRLLLYHLMQRIFIKKASFLDDSRIKIISYFPFFDAEEGNK